MRDARDDDALVSEQMSETNVDFAIIAAAQKVEHCNISAYTTAPTLKHAAESPPERGM
jgi:ferritin-like metal-binding protein YciE